MTKYYTKQDEAFTEVTFSDGLLISMIVEKHIKDALFNATSLINDTIKARIDNHFSTMDLSDLIDDKVSAAIDDYDIEDKVDTAVADYDIDAKVTEHIDDFLSNANIQVSIR